MITNNDIVKLAKVLATKEDIYDIHARLDAHDESFRLLTTIADNVAKTTAELKDDHKALVNIIDRHDRWIQQLANKTVTKLEV